VLIFNSWYTGGRSNIFTANDDGSNLRCLTADHKLERYQRLRISPDHKRLLFLAKPPTEETGHFFIWDIDAGRIESYENEPRPYDIRWLTDERMLCTKKDERWIVNLTSNKTERLDFGEGFLVMDAAPDGDRLLMKKGPGIGGSIFVGYIGRREVKEIVRGEEYEKTHAIVFPVSWSPNGEIIACVGGYEDEVWVVNADGSDPRKVATTDYFWRMIRWSPDGRAIAFTRSLDEGGPGAERGAVFVVELALGDERQVMQIKRGETWAWGAEGKSLVCARGSEGYMSLERVDIETQESFELIGLSAELKDVAELIVV
jgi:Tol biopolymer transport system component